jgi:two-component system, OmpR family, response regulator QseB
VRILIVEDDLRIAQPLAEDLRHQHHIVEIAPDGMQGWEYAQSQVYDLILLDLMLPKLGGIELCKMLRSDGSQALILMLTAKDTTSDKIVGLDAGADDYLVKPFELDELAARIRALSRRSSEVQPLVLTHGEIQLNPVSCVVTYASQPLSLTPKEHTILEYFLHHPQQVISKSALIDKLWEFDKFSGEETIKTHITNLRRKIKEAGSSIADTDGKPCDPIETVYGVGYRLRQIT